MVVPVPWLLDALLKLSTSTSPAETDPAVTVTGQIAYGLMSPLAGVVEPSSDTVALPARNEPAAGFSTVDAAACSVLYCPPADWVASPPVSPGGTAVLPAEPQPATARPA